MENVGYCPKCKRQTGAVAIDGSGYCEIHGRVFVDWNRPRAMADLSDLDGNDVEVGSPVVSCRGGADVGTVVGITKQSIAIVLYHDGTVVEFWGDPDHVVEMRVMPNEGSA